MTKLFKRALPLLLAAALLAGCGQTGNTSGAGSDPVDTAASEITLPEEVEGEALDEDAYTDAFEIPDIELGDEAVALASGPAAVSKSIQPKASGTKVNENDKAVIDYSNTADGYVMVKFKASTSKKLKAQVISSKNTYTYNITQGEWETFSLTDGNGDYTVKVFENTTGNRYAAVCTVTLTAQLKDEFVPFLTSNQYVDFDSAPNTVKQAEKLAGKTKDPMEKIKLIYNFVINNLTYNQALADQVVNGGATGYLPNLDQVLSSKKGICFDYAALMTGMLRSQGVPCKLVIGHAGTAYHAWINVWSEKDGWIDKAVYFNGKKWQRMDPTFISTSKGSQKVQKFVGDGSNYKEERIY